MDLRFGVKIYDNDWFLRHRLSPEQMADLLAGWGVTYVIAQSKHLPMPNSAVTSSVTDDDRKAYAALDDRVFRDALRARGIAYIAVLNICFDPVFSTRHPELLGLDQWGRPGVQEDWYVGMPPDRGENIAHKTGLLKQAVAALDPDAIHLGFIRWPGFWETWLDGDRRADKPEYCFSARTISAFNRETGRDVPVDDPAEAARIIFAEHRQAWTTWKCRQTAAAIGGIRSALAPVKPDLAYAINTLPFFRTDFDNAVEEVFGQDIDMLSDVVDVFEVMAYHQILAKPASWPAAVATDIRSRSRSRAVCTLQGSALYLEGMHAGRGRAPEITEGEFSQALSALAPTPVDGVCVFTVTDLLDLRETRKGRGMLQSLRDFRRPTGS